MTRGQVSELDAEVHEHRPVTFFGKLLRTLAGTLAAGLVVLALFLVAVYAASDALAIRGPETDDLVWHGAGAALAVALAVLGDRVRGVVGSAAAAGSVAVVAVVLWVCWLA